MKRAFTTCFKIDRILVYAEGGRFLHTGRPPPTFYNQPTCRGHCLLAVVSFCFARAFDIAAVAAAVPAQVAAALLHVVDSRNQGKQGVGCWQRPLYQGCQKKVGGRQHLEASPRRHALLHRGGFGKLGQLWALLCHFICLCSLGKAKAQQPKFKRAEMQFAHSLSYSYMQENCKRDATERFIVGQILKNSAISIKGTQFRAQQLRFYVVIA